MIKTKTFHAIIALIVIANVGLGIGNWVINTAQPQHWHLISGMVSMPLVWAYVLWSLKRRPLSEYSNAERRFFVLSVFSAGAIIAVAFSLRLIDTSTTFNFTGVERAWGIGIGLFLMALGNIIPKILSPLSAKNCSATASQSVQRFTGWAFVLAGFIHTLVWVFAPIKRADTISFYVVMAALVLVVLRYVWAMRKKQHA